MILSDSDYILLDGISKYCLYPDTAAHYHDVLRGNLPDAGYGSLRYLSVHSDLFYSEFLMHKLAHSKDSDIRGLLNGINKMVKTYSTVNIDAYPEDFHSGLALIFLNLDTIGKMFPDKKSSFYKDLENSFNDINKTLTEKITEIRSGLSENGSEVFDYLKYTKDLTARGDKLSGNHYVSLLKRFDRLSLYRYYFSDFFDSSVEGLESSLTREYFMSLQTICHMQYVAAEDYMQKKELGLISNETLAFFRAFPDIAISIAGAEGAAEVEDDLFFQRALNEFEIIAPHLSNEVIRFYATQLKSDMFYYDDAFRCFLLKSDVDIILKEFKRARTVDDMENLKAAAAYSVIDASSLLHSTQNSLRSTTRIDEISPDKAAIYAANARIVEKYKEDIEALRTIIDKRIEIEKSKDDLKFSFKEDIEL